MFLLSGCYIYKLYDCFELIDVIGIYCDLVVVNDILVVNDIINMGNLLWKEIFCDLKLQMLIEEGLVNNVDMQVVILCVKEVKVLLILVCLFYFFFLVFVL